MEGECDEKARAAGAWGSAQALQPGCVARTEHEISCGKLRADNRREAAFDQENDNETMGAGQKV